ncbi:hypothetical protein Bbelb_429690 [Branchiostoma belcheri]|nr:hypothetical protein Bbelb_429690 [Branchiostoma belcheri]
MARRLSTRREFFAYMRRLSAKFGPLRFQLAEIGGPSRPEMSGPGDVITSNSETVGRARHSCRWRRPRPDFMRLADAPGRERKNLGRCASNSPKSGDRPVRRCPALVTSSLATGETLGRARPQLQVASATRLYALGRRTWARGVS